MNGGVRDVQGFGATKTLPVRVCSHPPGTFPGRTETICGNTPSADAAKGPITACEINEREAEQARPIIAETSSAKHGRT